MANVRNRLIRVSVSMPDAHLEITKHYREIDLASLIAGRNNILGADVGDMIDRLQEITVNDPET
jgi:hypothetical protein